MIWILHYILFNSGLSAVLILLTLFLQTYSKASMSEIGLLLMVLPFLAVFIKPVFCALADRQRAHRQYMIGALIFMALGYGSLILVPCFFADLIEESPNLVWYSDVVGIVIGFSAFGLTWSLGDALSVEAARKRNISWGSYRVWGTVSWGFFGAIVGQINETPLLPKYIPAFIVLVISAFVEAALIGLWPQSAFESGAPESGDKQQVDSVEQAPQSPESMGGDDQQGKWTNIGLNGNEQVDPERSSMGSVRGLDPRLVASVLVSGLGDTLKSSLKLSGARKRAGLDEIIAQHAQARATPPSSPQFQLAGSRRITEPPSLNGSIASRKNAPGSRPSPMVAAALANALAAAKADASGVGVGQGGETPQTNRKLASSGRGANSPPQLPSSPEIRPKFSSPQQERRNTPEVGPGSGSVSRAATFGRAALRRTQMALQRMESLSAASGNAIANEIRQTRNSIDSTLANDCANVGTNHSSAIVMMSSLASGASLTRAHAAHLKGFTDSAAVSEQMSPSAAAAAAPEDSAATLTHAQLSRTKSVAEDKDLQLVLLKLIIRRDATIWKLLFVFTFFGALMTAHITYFFVHVEKLCRQHDVTFSSVSGAMLASHSISEMFSFLVVVPYYVSRVGHACSFATCGAIHAIRFLYYGTLYPSNSPYMGLVSEISHGIIYGVIYSLITDIANDCVNRVDSFLPELVGAGVVEPDIDPNELKLPLRATMQGIFSGAFDGLGNGLGALAGGIYLDHYTFSDLWMFCAYTSVLVGLFYPLTEWRSLINLLKRSNKKLVDHSNHMRPNESKLEQHV